MTLYEILLVLVVVFNAGGLIYAFRFHLASLKRGQKYLKEELEKLVIEVAAMKNDLNAEITSVKVDIAHIKGRMNQE